MPYADREKQLEFQREDKKRQAQNRRDMLLEGAVCADCGTDDRRVLDFHHRDPEKKTGGVRSMLSHSLERLLAEAAKCDILCANCHRIRHFTGP